MMLPFSILFHLLFLVFIRQIQGVKWETDLTKGTWWCTTSDNLETTLMERRIEFYDEARIFADGPTASKLCNLYFTNDDLPYSLNVEWDQPWNATGSDVKLTLFTRFSKWDPWGEVWSVTGEDSNGFSDWAEATRMARILLENPSEELVTFHFTIRPSYGVVLDVEPWLWAVIAIVGCIVLALMGLGIYFIWLKCCKKKTEEDESSDTKPLES